MAKSENIPISNECSGLVLSDKDSKGKERPWKSKKLRTLKLADSYKRLGETKRAIRVLACGSVLTFALDAEGKQRLHSANFCRERLCPMCAWRRSLKVFAELSKVMDTTLQEQPKLIPLFLTLTLRNCSADELPGTMDSIFSGWNRLMSRHKMRRIIKGWFRALEVTYNMAADTYHPHVHAILLVDKSYFKGKDYMETTEWVQMWRKSMELDYDPICDVRRVKNGNGTRKSLAEVAKYTVKDTDYITDDTKLTDKLVMVLGSALRNRRLYAYGGVLKEIAKRLGVEHAEDGDLVHIDEDTVRCDVSQVLITYRWCMGLGNYVAE